jgi:hypothetical protein
LKPHGRDCSRSANRLKRNTVREARFRADS